MKLRHLLTGTILTISLLAASAVTAFAAVSKGRFETVDSTTISGWAYNSDSRIKIQVRKYFPSAYLPGNTGKDFIRKTAAMDATALPSTWTGALILTAYTWWRDQWEEGTSPTPGHTPTAMGMPRQEALPAHRDWCPLGSLRLPLTAPAAPVPKAGDAIHVPAPLPRPDTPSQ